MREKIYVVVSNTDLTEGRGWALPIAWCEHYATAKRLAHKAGVMGSDAEIREFQTMKIDGCDYGPIMIQMGSLADAKEDERMKLKKEALEKAKALGLSEEEIKNITS